MLDFNEQPRDLSAYEPTRVRVREFLSSELAQESFNPWQVTWTTFDRGFSRRAGQAGFIGMTWPREYGGQECSALERYVVVEEMLAAGAPCGAHWIADRQSGPQILRHGSERARREILPRIACGECAFGIGMSEPDSGSDLAAVRTRAEKVEGGWMINGTKVWTTNAHQVDYLITLVRTSPAGDRKYEGLTQMITSTGAPGMTVRPILDLSGHHEFNEVHFENYFVPDDMLIGEPGSRLGDGNGRTCLRAQRGQIATSARGNCSAFSSTASGPSRIACSQCRWGRLVAHAMALRRMSTVVAGLLEQGANPQVEAALVKHAGTGFEREIPEIARLVVGETHAEEATAVRFDEALRQVMLTAPSFTLRGGTREIMRGVIARGLGLR